MHRTGYAPPPQSSSALMEIARSLGRGATWLAGGAWALLLFNNGVAGGASVACAGACWARMGWGATQAVAVRDVLARADNGTAVGGFSRVVRANATVLVRLQATP